MMYTKNSIKRLHSLTVDRAFDGLLPSSARSNIPSLRLLYRYRPCALRGNLQVIVFFSPNACVLSSLVYLIYFNREKKGELN